MSQSAPTQLISRTTILICCGVLAGIMFSYQIPMLQRINIAASCLVGVFSFFVIDSSINTKINDQNKKIRVTREHLNRRMELQLAALDSKVRELPDTAKAILAQQQSEAKERDLAAENVTAAL